MLYSHVPYHNISIIKQTQWQRQTHADFFIKIFIPLTLFVRVKKGYSRFACERELEIDHNCNILTPLLWPSTLCLSCYTDAGVHSTGCWLSLLHLISIFSGPQFIRTPRPQGLMWLSLPHLVYNSVRSSTQLPAPQLVRRTQLSYIIVRRPLDLWNRMFNCHQAEITVMQFRGHSLPVHHSVVAQWGLHLVPYYQP